MKIHPLVKVSTKRLFQTNYLGYVLTGAFLLFNCMFPVNVSLTRIECLLYFVACHKRLSIKAGSELDKAERIVASVCITVLSTVLDFQVKYFVTSLGLFATGFLFGYVFLCGAKSRNL